MRDLEILIDVAINPRTFSFLISGTIREITITPENVVGAIVKIWYQDDDALFQAVWESEAIGDVMSIWKFPNELGIELQANKQWRVVVSGASEGSIKMVLEIEE